MSETTKPIATPTIKIENLKPTQMSVGMIEVKEKIKEVQKVQHDYIRLLEFLKHNAIPAVMGPNKVLFCIDHHHMGRALHEAGVKDTVCNVLQDMSFHTSMEEFWNDMNAKHFVYPYDEEGKGPYPYSALPQHVKDLKNDPYRSLAGELRVAGGYHKTSEPFEEFLWADYLRPKIPIDLITKDDISSAVNQAISLAHLPIASKLPGYFSS